MRNLRQPIARVVVYSNDQVLLIRRSMSDKSRQGVWEIPGGAVDPGESFEVAAARETQEEAGIEVDPSDLQFYQSSSYEFNSVPRMGIVFLLELPRTVEPKLSHEHDKWQWVSISKIDNYVHEPYSKELLHNIFSSDLGDVQNATVEDMPTTFHVYSDGGSRGNPGPSASGYVIYDEQKEIIEEGGEYLGITTNNQAEYQAVRMGLERAIAHGAQAIEFFVDSQLVVKQMSGEYKIRNKDLWPVHERIKELVGQVKTVSFHHVPREQNKEADAKVNEVLDSHAADA